LNRWGLSGDRHTTQFGIDQDKVDQAVLAPLSLGRHEGYRTWEAFDWEIVGRLHQKGCISDPAGKVNSVLFTDEGLRESGRLVNALFGTQRRD
jgi:hypothetical protein